MPPNEVDATRPVAEAAPTVAAADGGGLSTTVPPPTSLPTVARMTSVLDACAPGLPAQPEGCPCRVGDVAACWGGAPGDRNRGMCHDGTQVCAGNEDQEFGAWGPCQDQNLDCGPEPDGGTRCGCVPGAQVGCDEDCSASIFCSLTATKTCLPDGTWGPCREAPGVVNPFTNLLADGGLAGLFPDGGVAALVPDGGAVVDIATLLGLDASVLPGDAGVTLLPFSADAGWLTAAGPCRSLYHGCEKLLGQREVFIGDCGKLYTCQPASP